MVTHLTGAQEQGWIDRAHADACASTVRKTCSRETTAVLIAVPRARSKPGWNRPSGADHKKLAVIARSTACHHVVLVDLMRYNSRLAARPVNQSIMVPV